MRRLVMGHESTVRRHTNTQKPRFRRERPQPRPALRCTDFQLITLELEPGIQGIPQPIAKEIDPEHREQDGEPREGG